MTAFTAPHTTGWLSAADCSIDDFAALVEQQTDLSYYRHADSVDRNVLIYGERLRAAVRTTKGRSAVQTELMRALTGGPGVVVFKQAFDDVRVVDRATDAFFAQIAAEKAAGVSGGDHFAKPGANDRVWGALDKLAVAEPAVFAEYYANDIIALISESWLGPGYQLTSQVNVVNPGGQAQVAHRDYHLGFMDVEAAARFPAQVHRLSPALTLQGAVAHCDMPVVSGPTLYLPHSQKYSHGYVAYRRPEFQEYFEDHHIQLPLAKGDAVFFNPALFHAAGSNHSSDIKRMANLLQISSAFGRTMETVDRERTVNAIYAALQVARDNGLADEAVAHVIAASAEGYSFPTNLDRDQPVGGLAPQTQAELVARAVRERVDGVELRARLAAQAVTRLSH